MNHHQLLDVATGAIATGAIEAIHQIPDTNYTEIIKLVLQIIVAVGSIISMISRKVKDRNNDGNGAAPVS